MAWYMTKLMFDSFIMGSDLAVGFAFLAVMMKMMKDQSAAGISLQSIIAILTLRFFHAWSHYVGIHFTPRALPMWPFKITDVGVVFAGFACLIALLTKFYKTYEVEKDNFGIQLFDRFGLTPKTGPFSNRSVLAASFLYVIIGTLTVIWYFIRSTTSFTSSLSLYTCVCEVLSALALVPQLWMFQKEKRASSLLGTFVVLVAVGRLCTLLFWVMLPILVGKWSVPTNRNVQICLEIFNIAILSDFLYYWGKARVRGLSEVVLSSDEV